MEFFKALGQAYDAGDEAAETFLQEAYGSPRAQSEPEFLVTVCNELGSFCRARKRYAESFDYFTEGLTYAAQCYGTDHIRYGTILMNRAGTSRMMGDNDEAIKDFEASLGIIARHENSGAVLASTWNNLGLAYFAAGRLADAESAMNKGIEVAAESGNAWMVGTGLINLASVYIKQERYEDALRCSDRAVLLYAADPDCDNAVYARQLADSLRSTMVNRAAQGGTVG